MTGGALGSTLLSFRDPLLAGCSNLMFRVTPSRPLAKEYQDLINYKKANRTNVRLNTFLVVYHLICMIWGKTLLCIFDYINTKYKKAVWGYSHLQRCNRVNCPRGCLLYLFYFIFYFTFYPNECGFPFSGRISQYYDSSVFKSCSVIQIEGKIYKKTVKKNPNEENRRENEWIYRLRRMKNKPDQCSTFWFTQFITKTTMYEVNLKIEV